MVYGYIGFIFHGVECTFHGLEYTFQGVEYTFQPMERKINPSVKMIQSASEGKLYHDESSLKKEEFLIFVCGVVGCENRCVYLSNSYFNI